MVAEFDENNLIDRRPLKFKLEREKEWERPLSFPGKVLAHEASGRVFVSDSNHNRVLLLSNEGEVLNVVGTGKGELVDGSFDQAGFNDPQGMDLAGDTLYVADTKNHAIRAVDLANQRVETIAGTGEQAMNVSPRWRRPFHGAEFTVGRHPGGRRTFHRHGGISPAVET